MTTLAFIKSEQNDLLYHTCVLNKFEFLEVSDLFIKDVIFPHTTHQKTHLRSMLENTLECTKQKTKCNKEL